MRTIDLNADLGELTDGALDAAIMPFISSCNIACGAHAGNPDRMRETIRLALRHDVAIGAHPGYADPANFGRVSIDLSVEELQTLIREQVTVLRSIAKEEGASVWHVKLHGALYNDLAFDYARSRAVAETLAEIDPNLRVIVFASSDAARAVEDAGLVAIHEVFADRAYTPDGRLKPRSEPGAVLEDSSACLAQAERFVLGDAPADSICVHGDTPDAVEFVSKLRGFFAERKVAVERAGTLEFTCSPLGERSLLARLPARIAKSTHRKIRGLYLALEGVEGVVERVPCYAELKVDFDPARVSFAELRGLIERAEFEPSSVPPARVVEIPVVYDGEDLARAAKHAGLGEEEVVRLHAEPTYPVYMLGFAPGFPYLGGLNPKCATPRLETPRISVPAGSVGIAGNQTGVYPLATPGGWNLIGRTALKLFDPSSENPFLLEAGDEVRFVPQEQGTARSSNEPPRTARRVVPTSVTIIEPGLYTTVQDEGRRGFLAYGLPPSGAMDPRLFAAANAAVGNAPNAAALEATGSMPTLRFDQATKIAIATVEGVSVISAGRGETVRLGAITRGYRAYIAFEGGVDVPVVMGSRSTYIPAKLGGFEGRPLRAGDQLAIGDGAGWKSEVPPFVPQAARLLDDVVRVIPGPEADWFDAGGLNAFLTESFVVSAKSDRTGIRLDGPELTFRSDRQMVSAGIGFGTIQVPPSGRPIVMMADHPTTGGYPRIGCVVEADRWKLAQARPGDHLRFREERPRRDGAESGS